ncbi:pyrimidine-nucleoside phosphorylase [Desulfotruncus alcoholivorax]|uniref:pyrimidine-nucleoside phosphorylase n=1 Tax=Desulfotruncus alcoholivorax TaxID=265477 RepID=UPI000427D33B|nr:pyrimidine-nucleoside phosphorylase [Desulfotruncus alcoholivorax]
MQMYDLIYKKRNGGELTREEINYFIQGYTAGTIPDYQVSALMMAIYFQGMTGQETADLTMAMVNSGELINLEQIPGTKVDKHSTGGVGDKTTLVLAPLVASAGVPVAKMSGRGLGHTGGTIDKLESIPGFNVNLQPEAFIKQVREIGIALMAQTGIIAPADKKLYALRDVTATVDSIPLIASSVTSKKIASGADAILLDVKCGSGAFMKTRQEASALAKAMVAIGKMVNRRMVAVVTDMGQPLGYAVGNALEVKEALATLKGEGPADLRELCLTLGSHMLVLGEVGQDTASARDRLEDLLKQGKALQKFHQLIEAQGGDASVIDDPDKLPEASFKCSVTSPEEGFIAEIDTMLVGRAAMLLGAGRASKDDLIDHAAGIVLTKKPGDFVKKGEELAVLHTNREDALDAVAELAAPAFKITSDSPEKPQLILETIGW